MKISNSSRFFNIQFPDFFNISVLLLLFSAFAWINTAILLSRSIISGSVINQTAIGAASLATLILFCVLLRKHLPSTMQLSHSLDKHGLMIAIILGVSLRIIWALIFQPKPMSDGALYIDLARQILAGDGMRTSNALAYWPPGYSFFLTPFLALFSVAVAVPLSQCALFAVAAIGVHRLACQLGSVRAGTIAVFLFAIWPNLIALCATPEKEMLVTACLVWAVVAYCSSKPIFMLLAGMLFGAAALVQPSTQLLIPAAILVLVINKKQNMRFLGLFVLGVALALAPWAVRNYAVLGEFKLISTNGGDVLYRANNPLATGDFTERGAIDLSGLSELERDRVARSLALSWIKSHPLRFAELSIEKQRLFMGDDSYGVFATFRGERSARNVKAYAVLKLIANAWWLMAWLLVAVLITRGASLGPAAFLVWGWLYLFGIHSVFESNGRYHIPLLWILCICLSVLMTKTSVSFASPRSQPLFDFYSIRNKSLVFRSSNKSV